MFHIPSLPYYSNKRILVILLLIITFFGIRIAWDIPQFVDLMGWDEGVYMQNGLLFTKKLQKDWGPMYAAWYYMLHFFKSNPADLYLLNFQVLTVLPGILLFIFWYFSGIRPLWAALVGMFYMASQMNFYSWPKISLFTLVVLLCTFIVSRFFKNVSDKLIVVAGGTLLASYMRPELYLAFFVLILATITLFIYNWIKKQAIQKSTYGLMGFLIVGILGLQIVLGNPLFSMGGMRAMAAFGQHYAFNYAIWNDLRMDTWQLHGEQIFTRDFGRNFDFFSAYTANPEAFTRHVSSNILHYFQNIATLYSDILMPESIFRINAVGRCGILALIFIVLLLTGKWSFKSWWNLTKKDAITWILLLLVIGPTFISVVLIFPREHYMVLQLPLLLTMIVSFSKGIVKVPVFTEGKKGLGLTLAIGLILILFAPSSASRPYFDNFRDPKGNFNHQAVQILENMTPKQDTVNISEDEGGIIFFLNESKKKHFKWIIGTRKTGGFNAFKDSTETQLYYVTPLMLYNEKYLNDPEWQLFIQKPDSFGFSKIEIDKEWYFLYDPKAITYRAR
jgi:hypothetical protein